MYAFWGIVFAAIGASWFYGLSLFLSEVLSGVIAISGLIGATLYRMDVIRNETKEDLLAIATELRNIKK